ncbi:hypothetical protein A7981_05640 [Methylovorus sp. MM2]|uniref:hypothetical protein n=1 Tax=Methylovorus sp. MM2 TaxID=1848038 RepID=UPI0007DE90CC|nr:hypothetical protein [Methylovorus sp. MM2]OAM52919.1 hypothetical protein A7981_05640 [Methylovorus sp. MM2]
MDKESLGSLVSNELIEHLNHFYPLRGIQKGQSLEDAHAERGNREVIDLLTSALADFTANSRIITKG